MTRPRTISDAAILDAARRCAIERGPAVSLGVIAERLGVTSPALLKRFGTRRDLMIAALRPEDPPEWVRALARGPDARALEAQLHALLREVLEVFRRESPCMTALSESGIPPHQIFDRNEPPPPVRHAWAVATWLERGRARGLVRPAEYESIAIAMLGALHARVFLSDFFGDTWWRRAEDDYVGDLASTFARALAPAPPSKRAPRRPGPRPVTSRTRKGTS